MALYVIGDTHLSFYNNKPMDIFGDRWKNHPQKLIDGFKCVSDEDTVVICGDLSWAMNLKEAEQDFRFIDELPGQKIILKGNHDYWWTTANKAYTFFKEKNFTTIRILNNNCYTYGEYSLCGTRGWFFEEETGGEHDAKIMRREIMRLEASLSQAPTEKRLVFLHYPPIYLDYRCNEIIELLKKYDVMTCCYGHIHGKSCRAAYNGQYNGTEYLLVSADHLNFAPVKLLD